MERFKASAFAHPNIAFIKYWGNRDQDLRLPANGSISMNLAGLISETTVEFSPDLEQDSLILNSQPATAGAHARVTRFLDLVRQLAGSVLYANVNSFNNFPTGAGIASSASAFASLALAATHALGLDLNEPDLSRLARRGSGSACRSIPAGFVEWQSGTGDPDSYAVTLAPPTYWDLVDLVTIVQQSHKHTGSTEGHSLSDSSLLNPSRVADSARRLHLCRSAILARDFEALAMVTELDSNLMHSVMMTSVPPLFYWEPATLRLLKLIPQWRKEGLPACYTVDAGPNVHVICQRSAAGELQSRLSSLKCVVRIIPASPGGSAQLKTG